MIPIHPNKKYIIEVKHRPAIPNNVKYWQVFEDDDHIESFLTFSDDFENMEIDEESKGVKIEEVPSEKPKDENSFFTHIVDKEILQLKNNSFLKGLVPLEELFDQNDVARTPGVVPIETEVEDFKIRTAQDPKFIKISKTLPQKVRMEYIALLKNIQKFLLGNMKILKYMTLLSFNIQFQ